MNGIIKKKRNGEIEFLRFVFATCIVLLHFGVTFHIKMCGMGSIGVEFFFIVSGYFVAASAMKDNGSDIGRGTWRFILKRAKSFYPYLVIIWTARLIVLTAFAGKNPVKLIFGGAPLYTMLYQAIEIVPDLYISATWYLSCMIVVMFIMYPVIVRYRELALRLIFPVLSLIILREFITNHDRIVVNGLWSVTGFFNTCMLRAAMDMMTGAFMYALVSFTDKYEFKAWVRAVLTVVKLLSYGIVFAYIFTFIDSQYEKYVFCYLILAIFLSMSELTYRLPDIKLFSWLGKYSLVLYIVHGSIREGVVKLFGDNIPENEVFLWIAVCYASAILMMYAVPAICRLCSRIRWIEKEGE